MEGPLARFRFIIKINPAKQDSIYILMDYSRLNWGGELKKGGGHGEIRPNYTVFNKQFVATVIGTGAQKGTEKGVGSCDREPAGDCY